MKSYTKYQLPVICSFREKCDEKYLFHIKDSKILKKSLNRKLTCKMYEVGKRGMGPLNEVIHQISIGCDMQVSEKSATKNIYFTRRLQNYKEVVEQEVDMRKA